MGRGDRRQSRKMIRANGQRKKKERLARKIKDSKRTRVRRPSA